MMHPYKIVALFFVILGYLLFGIGGYAIYFLKMPMYAFLLLPFSLFCIALGFKLAKHKIPSI